jgi:flagellar hook-basal body complex protein FliE
VDIIIGKINPIQSAQKIFGQEKTSDIQEGTGFGDFLNKAVEEVNALQQDSSQLKSNLVTGEIEDIHQVMIAAEKANLAFQLTLQIRNKVIEAYQEIMRMQV